MQTNQISKMEMMEINADDQNKVSGGFFGHGSIYTGAYVNPIGWGVYGGISWTW